MALPFSMTSSFPGCPDSGFSWGMSLLASGSMRFRWNEVNENRQKFLSSICPPGYEICQVELIHSRKVIAVKSSEETLNAQCDGIVTDNPRLIPVVTVADCMPVYIANPSAGVFGVLHSGWKGTGIAADALDLCSSVYGTNPSDFYIVLGPHIRSCCYNVDESRRKYFSENFTPDCVSPAAASCGSSFPYSLSLEKANLAALKRFNIPSSHVYCQGECTCCTTFSDGSFKFGSNRRQTSSLPSSMSLEEKGRHFTVQAAWIMHDPAVDNNE